MNKDIGKDEISIINNHKKCKRTYILDHFQ